MTNAQHTDELANLIEQIEEGWKVKIIDHDYLNASRDDVTVTGVRDGAVILTPKKPWASQGRSYPTVVLTWRGDLEVEGTRVRLYHTPPPRTGKPRRLVRTYVFSPPSVR